LNTKKIVFLTGTRAEYGKMKSLIKKVDKNVNFECHIFVTGMHMLDEYGYTIDEVIKDKYNNIFPFINQTIDMTNNMDLSLANTIIGFRNYIKSIKPDLIILHGDRPEALAGAIVGVMNNIKIAHIEGGEVSGTIDDSIRHAVSKLSHLHFVSNEVSKKRLVQMGESENSIYIIGSPDIDIMLSNKLPKLNDVLKHYSISFKDYGIFLYHPVTTEVLDLFEQINQIISAMLKSNKNYILIHPNNDKGRDIIYESILKRLTKKTRFRILPSLRFENFLTLLKNSKFILGNSSAGIIEAPVYGIPTINVGSRQNNRLQNNKILNVNPICDEIIKAIKKSKAYEPKLFFGKGNSAKLFMKYLNDGNLWDLAIQKYFNDIY